MEIDTLKRSREIGTGGDVSAPAAKRIRREPPIGCEDGVVFYYTEPIMFCSKIPYELPSLVVRNTNNYMEALNQWCLALDDICSETIGPAAAISLVYLLLAKVSRVFSAADLQLFCRRHALPANWIMDLVRNETKMRHLMKPLPFAEDSIYELSTISDLINNSIGYYPTILHKMASCDGVDTVEYSEALDQWCEALGIICSEPMTPAEATRLVLLLLEKVSRAVSSDDIEAYCLRHRIMAFWITDLVLNEGIITHAKSTASEGSTFTCGLASLSDHIKRFETDPKIMKELDSCGLVDYDGDNKAALAEWCKALKKIPSDALTPAAATRIVLLILEKFSDSPASGLQGFCRRHGLPAYWTLDLARNQTKMSWTSSFMMPLVPDDASEGEAIYRVGTLSDHIKRFDTDPTILDKLASCEDNDDYRKALNQWCEALEWIRSDAMTPAAVARVVLLVLGKVSCAVSAVDLEDFCADHWLPYLWTIDLVRIQRNIKRGIERTGSEFPMIMISDSDEDDVEEIDVYTSMLDTYFY